MQSWPPPGEISRWAGWFIVWAAVTDLLDGRVARFTRTGSAFGEELDSLVDAISFGVAPAFIMYTLYFSDGTWSWVLPLLYVMAVVVRLARFNMEQEGEAKRHFHGLPSPTPGIILATFYPFSQTAFFQTYLLDHAALASRHGHPADPAGRLDAEQRSLCDCPEAEFQIRQRHSVLALALRERPRGHHVPRLLLLSHVPRPIPPGGWPGR